MSSKSYERSKLSWNGWGAVGERFPFGERESAIWQWMEETLGDGPLVEHPPVALDGVDISPPQIWADDAPPPKGVEVTQDDYERVFHAAGRSFRDIVRLRTGTVERFPDAVAYPTDDAQIEALLAWCERIQWAVVPFGGGSSVVGGVEPLKGTRKGVLCLDTTRLHRLLRIDPVAMTATAQAGIYGPDLEDALQAEGYTLGHYPQSFRYSTLGGWVAARGSGQQSAGYGGAARWLVASKVITPQGVFLTQDHPNSAAGPDLRHWVAGSEGTLGVISDVTVRISRRPATREYHGVLFPSFEAGARAVKRIAQAGLPMAMMRLSDAEETLFFGAFGQVGKPASLGQTLQQRLLPKLGFGDQKSIMLMGVEGAALTCKRTIGEALAVCIQEGGVPLGAKMGQKWYGSRFDMPYLRDPMFDRGIGVETLETSTTWSNLSLLHTRVRETIRNVASQVSGAQVLVMGHISHVYPTGASLYFTFVWKLRGQGVRGDAEGEKSAGDAALKQWAAIKKAASDVIAEHGGTISHHHGVGTDHLPWMTKEKGAVAVDLMRAARDAVDPQQMMNPDKLLPPKKHRHSWSPW